MAQIKYQSGYKYQLVEGVVTQLSFKPPKDIHESYIHFTTDGKLFINKGYAWDGPSGPTIDTNTFMRGSLIHDALYQLMRDGLLDHDTYREKSDQALHDLCIEDGMCSLRAWWVLRGVRDFGHPSADPRYQKEILIAP